MRMIKFGGLRFPTGVLGAVFFFARLLPVVRHLISIPAGIVRMNFAIFSGMTIVGSFNWCYVLAEFGTRVITADMMSDPTKMVSEIKAQSH